MVEQYDPRLRLARSALDRHVDDRAASERRKEHARARRELMTGLETLRTPSEVARFVDRLDNVTSSVTVSFLNAHAFNSTWDDPQHFAAMRDTTYVLRDGIGVKIGFWALQKHPGLNMNGTDFIPRLIKTFRDKRLAIIGADPHVCGVAADRLNKSGATVVYHHHGFEPIDFYADAVTPHNPEIVLIAMGVPKQDLVAQVLRSSLKEPAVIISGGAIVDFVAGRVARAPMMWRRFGCEWVYRLLQEPRRLARRYLIGNPLYLSRLARMAVAGDPERTVATSRTASTEKSPATQRPEPR
ncbi:MAG: WecB/TagA/CpsF family glycosyltransferase [Pseudomonadota bacterium]